MSFSVKTKAIKELEADLKAFKHRAYPFATREAINSAAFAAQSIAKADVAKGMTLRNKHTLRSIQVDKAGSLNVRNQIATVGSTADYMETQEFGGAKNKQGDEGVPIATSFSSGEGENSRPRKRLPRRANRVSNVRFNQARIRAQSRKRRNVAKVGAAARSGSKYVFLRLRRSKGIFKVVGGKRKPRIKMVHDMSRGSVLIPRNPWLRPAMIEAQRMMPAFYAGALRRQLRKFGLFRE